MEDKQHPFHELNKRLEILLKKQEAFSIEINELRNEIHRLRYSKETEAENPEVKSPVKIPENTVAGEISESSQKVEQPRLRRIEDIPVPKTKRQKSGVNLDLEKFIGENLVNKIGILIIIIGVVIGSRYAFEHQLISPGLRILLGYVIGLGLMGFAYKLKENYLNFSAVLLSGSMAILYFISFAAHAFYGFLPQVPTFALMLVFTIFTVFAALNYNRQVIAHIGLVGAYAIPFLLSDGSGNVGVLFTYMAIINAGILFIAFKKYWKPLYYLSFASSYLIFFGWFTSAYHSTQITLGLMFLSIFFITFYIMFLAYKLHRKETFGIEDVFLLLANSFIFYGLGYGILSTHEIAHNYLGLFTICNALAHLGVSILLYREKLADKNLFYMVSGLVLVFITIAVPVQLDGNWVTLLWTGEAALLFWIGRTRKVPVYEKLSYPLMALAFTSIVHDWTFLYDQYHTAADGSRILPLFNVYFFTSLLFSAAFAFINYLDRKPEYPSPLGENEIFRIAVPSVLFIGLYFTFYMEIAVYWNQLIESSLMNMEPRERAFGYYASDPNLRMFKAIWLINYSLLFLTIVSFLNIKKIKDYQLGIVNLGLNAFAVLIFLTRGLYVLSELRENYLGRQVSEYFQGGVFNIGIRYVSLVFLSALLFACFRYIRQGFMKPGLKMPFELFLSFSLLWVASSEFIHLLDMVNSDRAYKLGLSILWGLFSLTLIAIGIWKKKKHLRVGAIALFGVTLLKLFLYDIAHLNTISKTIVFVTLGILLLIISFLYNKYKHLIAYEVKV